MATFLLEVGTEELPANFVSEAIAQWKTTIPADLEAAFLQPDSIEYYGTPRRLALLINGLPNQQPDREEEAKGPPAKAAFKDGKPTKAATGFAASRGVSVEDLEIRDTDKGEFIFVQQKSLVAPLPTFCKKKSSTGLPASKATALCAGATATCAFPAPFAG